MRKRGGDATRRIDGAFNEAVKVPNSGGEKPFRDVSLTRDEAVRVLVLAFVLLLVVLVEAIVVVPVALFVTVVRESVKVPGTTMQSWICRIRSSEVLFSVTTRRRREMQIKRRVHIFFLWCWDLLSSRRRKQ